MKPKAATNRADGPYLEDIYREVFQNAPDLMYMVSPDGNILDINRTALEALGYTRDELVGQPVSLLYSAAFKEKSKSVFKEWRERGKVRTEMEVQKKNGENLFVDLNVHSIRDDNGEIVCSVSAQRDITKLRDMEKTHKQMEDELRRSVELYSAIVNASEDIIIEMDAKGRLAFANARATKLAGDDGAGLRGKSVVTLFPRPFTEELMKRAAQVFEFHHSRKYEATLLKGDSKKNVLVHAVPIYGQHDDVETVLVSIKDTTELKRAEQLRLENLALEETEKLKNEFMATMSHELRTPLNAIIGYTELLQDQLYGRLNDNQLHQLEAIDASGNALLELINDLLDLSRIEAGRMELFPEAFSLEKVVREVLTICQPLAERKRHQVSVEVGSKLVAWADPMRVKQCLNNLLSNAIKFMFDGGCIRIRAQNGDDEVVVSVKDAGRGIPPEKLDAIFQPFYRIDASSTADVGGTGLGLTITRRLVEMMGGKVWAESEEGKGSEFHFTLPVRPPPEEDAPPH